MIMETFEEKCRLLNYELYLLHTISKSIKESLDENRILSVMLTGLTANVALGLSRAAVFYYNKEKSVIYGKNGIGPCSKGKPARYGKTWEATACLSKHTLCIIERRMKRRARNILQGSGKSL